jgi:hypothetical protein
VDPANKVVEVEVVGNEIEVPLELMDHVGALNMKPVKFLAHLNFGKTDVDWSQLKVSHRYDKTKACLFIVLTSGTDDWSSGDEIYVTYKNGNWFGW